LRRQYLRARPIPDEEILLPLPSGDPECDLLVVVGHRPIKVAAVRLKDAAGVIDVDLVDSLEVSALAPIHRSLLSLIRQDRYGLRRRGRSLGLTS
jgi:hypothetical protein